MKKLIFFMLCFAIAFAAAIPSAAKVTIDEAPDALASELDLVQLDCDIDDVIAYADSKGDKHAIVGYDKDENVALWMIDGASATKSSADILQMARENLDIPSNDDIVGGSVYVSDVYYFGGAYYVICCADYYCMCDAEGPHAFTVSTVLLCTENGEDFTAVQMPSFSQPMYVNAGGVKINKFGDKLIFASDAGGFEMTGERTDEYGYIYQTGVSYYYTSEDGVNWTKHASVECESMSLDLLFWMYQGISADGTALFQVFSESPTMTGGSSYGFYCTSDFTTYKELPESIFGDEYCDNTFNLARAKGSSDQTSIFFQNTMAQNYETFSLETTGVNVFAADDVSGEWVQKVDHDGPWNYYRYFLSDDAGCFMLDTGNGVNVYRWDGADGEVSVDTTDIMLSDFSSGDVYNYSGTPIAYILYKGNSLAVSSDMWESAVKLDLPESFTHFFILGDTGILVGENVYAVDVDGLSVSVLGEKAPSTPGDASGDGKVNIADASLILKKIAGWDSTLDSDAADVTGDGKVNLADVSLILKYIAGWDVTFK